MAPWLLLSLSLAQTSPAPDAQLTPEQRQGMAQSAGGTLDGGVGTPTGAPDPTTLPGTGGAGSVTPGTGDAGTVGTPQTVGTPYTVPSPFPGTADGGTAADPRFAPGTGSTAPGSTGPTQQSTPAPSTPPAPVRDTGRQGGTQAAAPEDQDPAGTVAMQPLELEGPPSAETPEEAAAALRDQVQALQARDEELEAEQQRLREQNEELQAQLTEAQERAEELEAARAERLVTLEDTTGTLVGMDALLSVGNTDVQGQLEDALGSLEQVVQSAEASGQGDQALWAARAREMLDGVSYAVENRNYYEARLAMQQAAAYMRAARVQGLEQNEGALLTPR